MVLVRCIRRARTKTPKQRQKVVPLKQNIALFLHSSTMMMPLPFK